MTINHKYIPENRTIESRKMSQDDLSYRNYNGLELPFNADNLSSLKQDYYPIQTKPKDHTMKIPISQLFISES